ncbi:MAG: AbrB/MazE/SpoVT family DNA-binding domain-containing protein [Candidatus Bathyarchaeia archaeon]
MARYEKPDITVVSSKGQVVIPQGIREKLGIGPKTKLLVYSYQDVVILKKLEMPDVAKELEEIYKKVDARIAKYGELTCEEVDEVIQEYRRKKRSPR